MLVNADKKEISTNLVKWIWAITYLFHIGMIFIHFLAAFIVNAQEDKYEKASYF